jgi:hypothetical protein
LLSPDDSFDELDPAEISGVESDDEDPSLESVPMEEELRASGCDETSPPLPDECCEVRLR